MKKKPVTIKNVITLRTDTIILKYKQIQGSDVDHIILG